MDKATDSTADKVRENRLRRVAERQGAYLEKSRRRDKRAKDYGLYRLRWFGNDEDQHKNVAFTLTLSEVEGFLGELDES